MTTRIAPGVGANLLSQHSAERNQDATAYVGNLDPQVSEEMLWELFVQAGPVVNVYVPKDRVTNVHQGYGFVEFRSEEDADYAIKVLNMIKLAGKPIRVNKASQDKKSVDVGANLFIGNLDPDVDEKLFYDTFSAFGVIVTNPKIIRDPDTGNSRGFGFISYDSFEASDAAIEAMNGQYLCNCQITVSYAYKKDTKGEHHGTPAESDMILPSTLPVSPRQRTNLDIGVVQIQRTNLDIRVVHIQRTNLDIRVVQIHWTDQNISHVQIHPVCLVFVMELYLAEINRDHFSPIIIDSGGWIIGPTTTPDQV